LEKLAPTLLAGMPAIIKPASQSAYLAQLMVQHIIDTGLLPAGSLQLVCGSVGDLLEHVDGQDVVTFTGSATTGRTLKTMPSIVDNAVRFTMEADSLNAAILGADAPHGTDEFDLFVREIVREVTVKAGQKCTAIRRAMVPRESVDAVAEALERKLSTVRIGNPANEDTRMGALISRSQCDEVRQRVVELQADADCIIGTPESVDVLSGNVAQGAYMSPLVMYCENPHAAKAIHSTEAFGPVCTLMPYDNVDDAIALTQLGNGSLVTSLFTNDAVIARDTVRGIAPFNGRVFMGNRSSAKSATGHGSPLPMLVHGGPGRAGGGEELGGIRAIKHYMQRTAVQGTPDQLTAVTDTWVPGSSLADNSMHPFRKSLTDLELGDYIKTESRKVTLDDIEHFAHFTGDTFYAHMDEDAAKANPFFNGRVAHGYLIVSFAAGLFVDPDTGPVLANFGVDKLRFMTPVHINDSLHVMLICKQINPRVSDDYGEVRWDCTVLNHDDAVVAQYDVLTLVAKQWPQS